MFVKSIKEHLKNRFAEWAIGIGLFSWGIVVVAHPDIFATLSTFENMLNIAPQYVWGWTAILIASIRLIFLTINGTWRRSAHLRAIGSALSASFWTGVWASYLYSENPLGNLGLATVGTMVAIDLYSLWFAAEDAGNSDRNTKVDKEILKRIRSLGDDSNKT